MSLFVRENLWAISVRQCFVNWKGWKPGIPLSWSGRPSYEIRTHQTGCFAMPIHTSCFVHATEQWLWEHLDNETGLGLGTGEQSQSGTAAPSKCTDPRIPGGGFGAAWQSLGEVVMGDSGTVVRWTTYTELALAGMGWLCQGPRSRGVHLQGSRKEPQVSIAAQFSQLGALHLNSLYLSQSQANKRWVYSNRPSRPSRPRVQPGKQQRERASHNWLIPQQGGSKSLYLSQSRAKVEWWTGMTILNAYFPIHIFQVAVTERDRLKGFCCDLPYSKQHYMKKDNS